MIQLVCIRPTLNRNSDLPWPTTGVIHPPHPVGAVNAGREMVVMVVADNFDPAILPPGWVVMEQLDLDTGVYYGGRIDLAATAPYALPGQSQHRRWIPTPAGVKT